MRGVLFFFLMALGALASVRAAEPRGVSIYDPLPFGQKPIDYWATDGHDPVAGLQRRIEDERLEIPFDARFGYLPAILKELGIPVESQILRFHTGSPHRTAIQAARPRAIYFQEEVSVAWFPGADQLEFTAHDPHKGTLFYTLTNKADALPRFQRGASQSCLGCHHQIGAAGTGVAVPGHLVRNSLSEEESQALNGPFRYLESHTLPIEKRWRNRYVTGVAAEQPHRGNLTTQEDSRRLADDPAYVRQVFDLGTEFDTDRYPVRTSDIVAHLVFDHQMPGLNLLARSSYEQQLNVRSKEMEPWLLRYLLLADEAPLRKPVAGRSAYADWYRQRGPLYEFNLETRLFRYRISPLIQSAMVRGLPDEPRQRLYRRLNDVLAGREELPGGYDVPPAEREETLAVLRAVIPDWPRE